MPSITQSEAITVAKNLLHQRGICVESIDDALTRETFPVNKAWEFIKLAEENQLTPDLIDMVSNGGPQIASSLIELHKNNLLTRKLYSLINIEIRSGWLYFEIVPFIIKLKNAEMFIEPVCEIVLSPQQDYLIHHRVLFMEALLLLKSHGVHSIKYIPILRLCSIQNKSVAEYFLKLNSCGLLPLLSDSDLYAIFEYQYYGAMVDAYINLHCAGILTAENTQELFKNKKCGYLANALVCIKKAGLYNSSNRSAYLRTKADALGSILQTLAEANLLTQSNFDELILADSRLSWSDEYGYSDNSIEFHNTLISRTRTGFKITQAIFNNLIYFCLSANPTPDSLFNGFNQHEFEGRMFRNNLSRYFDRLSQVNIFADQGIVPSQLREQLNPIPYSFPHVLAANLQASKNTNSANSINHIATANNCAIYFSSKKSVQPIVKKYKEEVGFYSVFWGSSLAIKGIEKLLSTSINNYFHYNEDIQFDEAMLPFIKHPIKEDDAARSARNSIIKLYMPSRSNCDADVFFDIIMQLNSAGLFCINNLINISTNRKRQDDFLKALIKLNGSNIKLNQDHFNILSASNNAENLAIAYIILERNKLYNPENRKTLNSNNNPTVLAKVIVYLHSNEIDSIQIKRVVSESTILNDNIDKLDVDTLTDCITDIIDRLLTLQNTFDTRLLELALTKINLIETIEILFSHSYFSITPVIATALKNAINPMMLAGALVYYNNIFHDGLDETAKFLAEFGQPDAAVHSLHVLRTSKIDNDENRDSLRSAKNKYDIGWGLALLTAHNLNSPNNNKLLTENINPVGLSGCMALLNSIGFLNHTNSKALATAYNYCTPLGLPKMLFNMMNNKILTQENFLQLTSLGNVLLTVSLNSELYYGKITQENFNDAIIFVTNYVRSGKNCPYQLQNEFSFMKMDQKKKLEIPSVSEESTASLTK